MTQLQNPMHVPPPEYNLSVPEAMAPAVSRAFRVALETENDGETIAFLRKAATFLEGEYNKTCFKGRHG